MNPFAKMKTQKKPPVVGNIRQHQLLGAFGIGSIVDFVSDTVIIAGIDDWDISNESLHIHNENLRALTNADFFVSPKPAFNDVWKRSRDIPAFIFPEKLYCTECKNFLDVNELRLQKNPHKCFLCKSSLPLVASRFVVICENGHIEDFPYSWWVHKGDVCPSGKDNPRIKMYNIGERSDIESLILQCGGCGCTRQMFGAFHENALKDYQCMGRHSHLKHPVGETQDACQAVLKTRLRSSSSVYFPVTRSALSIPPWSQRAFQSILAKYDDMKYISGQNIDAYLKERVLPNLPQGVSLEILKDAFNAVRESKQSKTVRTESDVYLDEYFVLSQGTLEEEGEYSANEADVPRGFERYFEKITAVDKLTNIEALCGFTREKPWGGDFSDETKAKLAPLSMKKGNWLPAMRMNGEGIFIEFRRNEIEAWLHRVGNRYEKLKSISRGTFFRNPRFSVEYVLLHTFAHLMIRQLANGCGYNAASLREKIYSDFYDVSGERISNTMHGVLIFIVTPDSEGSLGGLVNIARTPELFGGILEDMLRKALWCSADPLCSTLTDQGVESLNYAACHDCTLLPETSCESRNVFIDRISIVGMPENRSIGFMGDLAEIL